MSSTYIDRSTEFCSFIEYTNSYGLLYYDRYCDCFANGEFCNNCNCVNCSNNMEREKERSKAIKVIT